MHGNFYPQHYMQRSAQGNQSSNLQRNADLTQPGQIHFTPQHGLTNGQGLQGPGVQHLQQHRIHPTPHPSEFTQQHYSQFLQNQAFYNQLQQQQQRPSVRQQQEQHQRLLHQQLTPNDQTLRSLLSINHQLQLQQQAAPHHIAATQSELLQMQAAKAGTRFADERSRTDQLERSRSIQNHRNIPPSQNVLSPEMMIPRQHKPSSGPSPPHYHPQNPNYLQNMVLPGNRADLMSGLYSPARGHVASTRPQTSARPDLSQEHQTGYPIARTRSTSQDLQSPRRVTPTGVPVAAPVHVKRQTPSVNSAAEPVIIYDSDDDASVMQQSKAAQPQSQRSGGGSEPKPDPGRVVREIIDSDIEIVGYKEAEIMSHVRPDCPIHPFQRVDTVASQPLGQNGLKCGKCFCYVCDKPASNCEQWTKSSMPHCNGHARASCWKARRSVKKSPLIDRLPNDKITTEIEQSGEIGLQYMIAIRERYITYRNGTPCEYNLVPCECLCHRNTRDDPCIHCKVVHDAKKKFNYQPVREKTLSIWQEIKEKYIQDRPITALICLDAVLSELCSQRPADFNQTLRAHSNPDVRCQCNFPLLIEEHLEPAFIAILTRFEAPPYFLDAVRKSVNDSVKPLQLDKIMKKFKAMRHWDDLLLRAVMSGSNSTGSSKGRDQLQETPETVRHRIEKLDRENKFLQMLRYLRTVKLVSATRDDSILKEMDRWKLLCSAHRGRFKEVVVHLMDLLPWKNDKLGDIHRDFSMGFTLRILNALTQVSADMQFESFEPRTSQIGGLDSDATVFLVLLILNQKQLPPADAVTLILWLVKWVNRNPLSPSLDPGNTRIWYEQGSRLIALAHDSMNQGSATRLLESLSPRDPRVHLLVASICVVDFVVRNRQFLESHHRRELVEIYRNNEWALFLLLTQATMMSYHDSAFLSWLTKFCDHNNGVIAQIQDTVIWDAVKFCPLDLVSDFLSALVKPTWVCSIEPIKKTVVRVLSEFSNRLFQELPRTDKNFLAPKSRWIEDILLKPFLDRKLVLSADSVPHFKNVVKTACFLNTSKRIVELSRSVVPDEWPRHCDKLVRFLMEKFKKSESAGSDCFSGSAEEFSLLLSLLWSSRRREEFKFLFTHFQENHSCEDDATKATSSKIPDEIAALLDSVDSAESREMKASLLEDSRRLCLVETLSWLTCTSCASRMSSHWSKVWVSVSKFPSHLRQLITETLSQFKDWLNRISLDAPDSYARLLSCLKTFLDALVKTWQRCNIPLEEIKRLLIDVAGAVKDRNFQRDLTEMATSIVGGEMNKQRIASAPTIVKHNPVEVEANFESTQNHRTVAHEPRPKSPPQRSTRIPENLTKTQQNGSVPSTNSGNPQNSGTNTPKTTQEEEGPFSPLNLSRTKPCPNCQVTISCALFRCPHCNKPTKSKRPVICPGCHQENVEVKKYSCEFCYRSLIDVMFAGNEQKNDAKSAEKNNAKILDIKNGTKNDAKTAEIKKKAKNAEIRTQEPEKPKKKQTETAKNDTTNAELKIQEKPKKKAAEKRRKKSKEEPKKPISPKVLHPRVPDSSDSDDFLPEPPKKIPKLKMSFSKPSPTRAQSLGGSLTDSDSDSVCSEPRLKETPPQKQPFDRGDILEKTQFERNKISESHKFTKNNSDHNVSGPSAGGPQSNHEPQVGKEIVTQKTQSKTQPPNVPKKRGVGHSSAMSKNQKKLLRKFKNPKFPTTNSGTKSKDSSCTSAVKSTSTKPFENPPSGNHLHNPEKSVQNPASSGLTFGLAKVRSRNVGHRTGGRPGQQKKEAAKEFLFPQPLNDCEVSEKSRKRERWKKMLADNPQMGYKYRLEKKLASLVAKRKPGPARTNNYRKIAKIERRLRRLRKPHKSWKIAQNIRFSPEIDLSMHMSVSLSPFPKDKLKRIQSLVPQYRLATLYA